MIFVDQVTIKAGEFVLRDISLQLPHGCYGALMGRTGCGKSTMLEAIAGLKRVQSGRIIVNDRDVTHLPPAARGIGYVPQDGALFTTKTVFEQLAFALVIRHQPTNHIKKRVHELAELLGITHLLSRYPPGLSGGERQRIALGRALAFKPSLLLLDEPLSAIDEETRDEMYALLRLVHQESQLTALHVTHSPQEARALATHIFTLSGTNSSP